MNFFWCIGSNNTENVAVPTMTPAQERKRLANRIFALRSKISKFKRLAVEAAATNNGSELNQTRLRRLINHRMTLEKIVAAVENMQDTIEIQMETKDTVQILSMQANTLQLLNRQLESLDLENVIDRCEEQVEISNETRERLAEVRITIETVGEDEIEAELARLQPKLPDLPTFSTATQNDESKQPQRQVKPQAVLE